MNQQRPKKATATLVNAETIDAVKPGSDRYWAWEVSTLGDGTVTSPC